MSSFGGSCPDTILDTNSTTFVDQFTFEDTKQKLLHSINRFAIWLDCYLQDFDDQIQKLKTDLAEAKQENELLNKRSKDLLTIIVNAKNNLSFTPKKEDYEIFVNGHLKYFNEAINCFNSKCYIACIGMCRDLLISLVNEACGKNSISEGTLGAQIKKLPEQKIINGHYEDLVNVCKHCGDRSLHATREDLTPEKAMIALNSLIVLVKELFKK